MTIREVFLVLRELLADYLSHPSVRQERLRENYKMPNQYNLRRRIDRIMGRSGLLNCSMVILDPKGEILRDTGYLLMKKGYKVRVLDLIDMQRSHCYNPFVYLRDDNDVQRRGRLMSDRGNIMSDIK